MHITCSGKLNCSREEFLRKTRALADSIDDSTPRATQTPRGLKLWSSQADRSKQTSDWIFSGCWSSGVTLEIGTGLSWGRLPDWLARRTERSLLGLCAKNCWAKQSFTSLSPLLPSHPYIFFSFSLKTHTNAHTHTCLYLPAVPGDRAFIPAGGGLKRETQSLFVVKT